MRSSPPPPVVADEDITDDDDHTDNNNIKNKPVMKNEKNADDDNFLVPLSRSRSEEPAERMKSKQFAGYDSDLKLLESKGYNIVRSE
jgi:hypothetical protein